MSSWNIIALATFVSVRVEGRQVVDEAATRAIDGIMFEIVSIVTAGIGHVPTAILVLLPVVACVDHYIRNPVS